MICPFCQNEVSEFHLNSHIIPEWMHEDSYDPKHRAVSLNLDDLKKDIVQQGHRGSFICKTCEMNFSKDDNFGAQLLTNKVTNSKIKKELIIETRICQLDIGDTEVFFGEILILKGFKILFSVF